MADGGNLSTAMHLNAATHFFWLPLLSFGVLIGLTFYIILTRDALPSKTLCEFGDVKLICSHFTAAPQVSDGLMMDSKQQA